MLIKRKGICRECSEKAFNDKYKTLGFEVVKEKEETAKVEPIKVAPKPRGRKPKGERD